MPEDGKSVSRRDFIKVAGVTAAAVSLGGGLGGLVAGPVSKARAETGSAATATTPVTATAGPPPLAPPYVHAHDFSVITIGTSSPELSLTRGSACSMIQYKGNYYTVDAGTGSYYGFMRAAPDGAGTTQYGYRFIRGMFFSHLHQDHTTAYFDIATIRWMTGGKELLVVGPPYTSGLHKFLTTFWKDDLAYRMLRRITQQNLTGPDVAAATIGMFDGVTFKEIRGPKTFTYDGIKIKTAVMTHTWFDLAYRFEVDGKSIVISGDTAYDPDLAILAKDADILVVDGDAFIPGPNQPLLDPTKIAQKYQPDGPWKGNFKVGAHMNQDDLAKVLGAANPKKCVCTHLTPGPKDPALLLAAAQAYGFTGTIEVAADGKEYFPA
jgi:ribonuclease BN (tRNA processing enzyme)